MKRWLPLFVVALVAACSGARSGASNPFTEGRATARTIQINIENNNFNEATVRSLARTERRLGTVPGNGRESFTLDWSGVNDLRIQIDLLAGGNYTTNRVTVSPGESVFLIIETPIYRSLLRR